MQFSSGMPLTESVHHKPVANGDLASSDDRIYLFGYGKGALDAYSCPRPKEQKYPMLEETVISWPKAQLELMYIKMTDVPIILPSQYQHPIPLAKYILHFSSSLSISKAKSENCAIQQNANKVIHKCLASWPGQSVPLSAVRSWLT